MGLRDRWRRFSNAAQGDAAQGNAAPADSGQSVLEGIQYLQGLDDRYLLIKYQLDGAGQAIVARGNPDHAACSVIYVPGIGAALGSIGTHLARAEAIYRQASSETTAALAVTTWLDYAAPASPKDARDPSYATTAAAALSRHIVVGRITQGEQKARVVVVAHGYGGLVLGKAIRDHGLTVDTVILLGCASAGVDQASQLGAGERVYATSADINGDGTPLGIHGPRPDSPGFGAQILQPDSRPGTDPVAPFLPTLGRIIAAP